jgi:3-phosphoshikimate 1-carboxyvinyltransferase
MDLRIEGSAPLAGELEVPPDKSILHRALMLSALAPGPSSVRAGAAGEDNHSTARVLRGLGVSIQPSESGWEIDGVGPQGLRMPAAPLDCGNSGTTMRLMSGILAGSGLEAELVGDASLSRRPMGRVCQPLRALGADIGGRDDGGRELPPVRSRRGAFAGGSIKLEVASAQVKSALLLAGVASGRAVTVVEPAASRDHTERMLRASGAALVVSRDAGGAVRVALRDGAALQPAGWAVPGDFSSAAFFLAAGVMVPSSRVTVRDVGVNATRTGLLEVLEEYGARVTVRDWREQAGEPVATLTAESGPLRAQPASGGSTVIAGATIPLLIDELVVLAAVASQAEGTTEVRDARELRVKESDRIRETVRLLKAFGVQAEERPDGYVVQGPQPLQAAQVDVSGDHRLALTAAVLALAAPGESTLQGFEVAAVSYPNFVAALEQLGAKLRVR